MKPKKILKDLPKEVVKMIEEEVQKEINDVNYSNRDGTKIAIEQSEKDEDALAKW